MTEKPLLSIIVAVYNVEKYIEKCIESILNQNFENFELILVDDGSKDSSGDICDKYAVKDSRVTVIHKENGGATSARKAGLNSASGKYIGVVDGDDWIEPDMYAVMIGEAEKNKADAVCCSYFCDNGMKARAAHSEFREGIYEGERLSELKSQQLSYKNSYAFGISPSLWSKIYFREKLIPFQSAVPDRIKMGEDVAVTVPYITACDRVQIIARPLYHYRINETSITHTYNPKLLEEDVILQNFLAQALDPQWRGQLDMYSWRQFRMVLFNNAEKTSSVRKFSSDIQNIADMDNFARSIQALRQNKTLSENKLFSCISEKKWEKAASHVMRNKKNEIIKQFIKKYFKIR